MWKLLSFVAAAMHWFNPAAWILVVMLGRDLEVSCDEWAVRKLNREQKAGYALSLIAIAERPQSRSPLTSGFSQNLLEERVRCIMTSGKKSMIALFTAILMILCTTAVFATDAPEKKAEARKGIEISWEQTGDDEMTGELEALTASEYEAYVKREIASMKQQVKDGKMSQKNYDKRVKERKDTLDSLKEGPFLAYKTVEAIKLLPVPVSVVYQQKEDGFTAASKDKD